ncbi:hypothetical protein BEK98_22300 [Streptomyces diastatochromogenes]|uniref:Uncharacterized protein n=1 Tax=Streptomyces diastatochromogenes TaxID=42236 RepID=A0A233SCR9_STRDA|nr:DUF6233 domain-containing protein [Streptomyces diastatochromogenes]OXY93447.1 hypothetical protein BEK98_22300 [Streptomyces diastatochromogenes]
MSELPPDPPLPSDPPRLREILAYLDEQLAKTETIAIYLRLQRDKVKMALARAEGSAQQERPRQPERPMRKVKGGGPLPGFAQSPMKTGYVVQQKRTPHGPEPAFIHLADCTMIEGTPHRIRPDEARAALTDPKIEPCRFCRPDTELGTDLA